MANKPIETPLPADLPENWQRTQTVSPSGTEVGLTQQHGYNYLMQQVNAAQEGVNALNDAFPNLYGTDSVPSELLAGIGAQSTTNLLVNPRLKYNSRDQASYTGAAWTADGWYASAGMALAGATLTASAAGATFLQPVKHGEQYLGQEVTASVLVQGQDVLSCTCTLPASAPAASATYGTASASWGSLTVSYDATAGAFRVSVGVANGTSAVWVGAKLEAGGVSTLEAELASPPPEDVEKLRLDLYDLDPGRCAYLPWHNENLLDNWYFVGGGSQQGGGQFPINQRGQTSYTEGAYGIDRWRTNSSDMAVAVTAGGITVSVSAGDGSRPIFEQVLPFMFSGKMCTLTVLTTDGKLYSGGAVFPASNYTTVFTIPNIGDARLNNRRGTGDQSIYLILNRGATIQIAAIKLELGPVQTLAHQDADGNWVLNDPPPNFQQELAKCQRYQILLGGNAYTTVVYGTGYSHESTEIRVLVPTPVAMRINPTIEFSSGDFSGLRLYGGGGGITPTSASADVCQNGVAIKFQCANAVSNEAYALKSVAARIMLNCNL